MPTIGFLHAADVQAVSGLVEDDAVEEVRGAQCERCPIEARSEGAHRRGCDVDVGASERVECARDVRRLMSARDPSVAQHLGEERPIGNQCGGADADRVGDGPGGEHVSVRVEREGEHITRGEPGGVGDIVDAPVPVGGHDARVIRCGLVYAQ